MNEIDAVIKNGFKVMDTLNIQVGMLTESETLCLAAAFLESAGMPVSDFSLIILREKKALDTRSDPC